MRGTRAATGSAYEPETKTLGVGLRPRQRRSPSRPALLPLTKFDDADSAAVARFGEALPGLPAGDDLVLDDARLGRLKTEPGD